MAQIFHSGFNTLARLSVILGVAAPVGLIAAASGISQSPANTKVGVPLNQPVPFSHEHHANELGIDCRYCHTNVEKSATAGVPPTETCMSCHSQIWTNSPLLEPVRESYRTGAPITSSDGEVGWNQVNKVPEFVYFNHSIHIKKGVTCNVCHGPINTMQLTYKAKTFFMAWCLSCHRHPEKFIRPEAEVKKWMQNPAANENARSAAKQTEDGLQLIQQYNIKTKQLVDCWVCHR